MEKSLDEELVSITWEEFQEKVKAHKWNGIPLVQGTRLDDGKIHVTSFAMIGVPFASDFVTSTHPQAAVVEHAREGTLSKKLWEKLLIPLLANSGEFSLKYVTDIFSKILNETADDLWNRIYEHDHDPKFTTNKEAELEVWQEWFKETFGIR